MSLTLNPMLHDIQGDNLHSHRAHTYFPILHRFFYSCIQFGFRYAQAQTQSREPTCNKYLFPSNTNSITPLFYLFCIASSSPIHHHIFYSFSILSVSMSPSIKITLKHTAVVGHVALLRQTMHHNVSNTI